MESCIIENMTLKVCMDFANFSKRNVMKNNHNNRNSNLIIHLIQSCENFDSDFILRISDIKLHVNK